MNNIFPLYENVCIEEFYGQKRVNAFPPTKTKTYVMNTTCNVPNNIYCPPQENGWFKDDHVSQYERNALPCLLDNIIINRTTFKRTMTDDVYLKIRNEIVNMYKKSLSFLSLSSVYSSIGGSLDNISKIFSFLENKNLINNRNQLKECRMMINDLLRHSDKTPFDQNTDKHTDKSNETKEDVNSQKYGISADDLDKKCQCNNPASYRNKDGQYICIECFDRGHYDCKYTSSDFQKLDADMIRRKWSKIEEIKLLEAIDIFGDDWKRVASHVETKGAHGCVLFFVNMAIQEKNLKNFNFSIRLPFVKTPNPVMYLITFISSVVHPTLGSIAAHEAMLNIENSSLNIVEAILKKVKSKAKELAEFENKKIKRIDDVLEEAMLNLIASKTQSYKDLCSAEDKVRQELINLRLEMCEDCRD